MLYFGEEHFFGFAFKNCMELVLGVSTFTFCTLSKL